MTTSNEEVMLEFFRQATAALENARQLHARTASLGDIRQRLLTMQIDCLQTTLDCFPSLDWKVQDLQEALSRCGADWQHSLSVQNGMDEMNAAARLAFCRLVLLSEYMHDLSGSKRNLLSSGDGCLKHDDVLEFCGLCCAAIKLPSVHLHLQNGSPLFEHLVPLLKTDAKTDMLPQKRLEGIQRMFLRASVFEVRS